MFDWYDYYDLAEELSQESSEAHRRSAVSRVYYALYCNARNGLSIRGEWNPENKNFNESDHTYLWNKLESDSDENRRSIGQWGHRLRRLRNDADYKDHLGDPCTFVKQAMGYASKIKTKLEKL